MAGEVHPEEVHAEGRADGEVVPWRILYRTCRVAGRSRAEWLAAPDSCVQVVIVYRTPVLGERRWSGVTDRLLWTGDDEYDPFGWGAKFGCWMDRTAYELIWREALWLPKP